MSSFNRRILLSSLVALGACGFQPAYGPKGGAQALRGRVLFADPGNENDFALLRRLEERLGRPEAPLYRLSYRLSVTEEGLAITPAQETTRYNVLGKADFSLTEIATGRVVLSGAVDNFTSYSATGTTVSTQTAKRDSYARLMVILADRIVGRLLGVDLGAAK